MGMFERMRGNSPDYTVREIDAHDISFAVCMHAINREYSTEASKGARAELVADFDLRTEVGVTTYPTAAYPNETGTYDEGDYSDQDDLDAIRGRYETMPSDATKSMYFILIMCVCHRVHSGTITVAEGRQQLKLTAFLPGGARHGG